MVSAHVLVAVSGVITLSLMLMGCGNSSSGTMLCPDSATFPESPTLLTGSGTLTQTQQGVTLKFSGSFKQWFSDHNMRMYESMSATYKGKTVSTGLERIEACANDSATVTAHEVVSLPGQNRSVCASAGHVAKTCANISMFGEPNEASCQKLEKCPGSSEMCEVWTIKPSSNRAKMLGSMSASVAKALNPTNELVVDALPDDAVPTLYFLNGTNQLVAEKLSKDGLDMVLTYESWDTTTKIRADLFDVPTEWEPCSPAGLKIDEVYAQIQV